MRSAGRVPGYAAFAASISGLAVFGGAAAGAAPPAATPAQLVTAARAATLAASNVRVVERLVVAGESTSITFVGRYPTFVRLDVATGTTSASIIVRGATTYLEGTAGFWTSSFRLSATAAASFAGRWYETDSNDALLGATKALNPRVDEQQVFTELAPITHAKGLAVRRVAVGGRPAYVIGSKTGAVYIAATGKPYLLRLTTSLPGLHAFVQFSDYDAPLHPVLPATSTPLDAAYGAAVAGGSTTGSG